MEGEALLDRILENTPLLEPLHVEPEPSHEEVSSTEAEPITSLERPSPEPEDLEEGRKCEAQATDVMNCDKDVERRARNIEY